MGNLVRIRPAKLTGRDKLVKPRQAEALVRMGLYVFVEDEPVEPVVPVTPPRRTRSRKPKADG